jgi:hypothetical protein
MQESKKRTQGGQQQLRMAGTVGTRRLPDEGSDRLGLEAGGIHGALTKLLAQERVDVPAVIGHGRLGQALVLQQVTPVAFGQLLHGGGWHWGWLCRGDHPRLPKHPKQPLQGDSDAPGGRSPLLSLALQELLQDGLVEVAQLLMPSPQPAIKPGDEAQLAANGRGFIARLEDQREVGLDVGGQRAEPRTLDVMRW